MSDALTRMRISLQSEGTESARVESLLHWARAFLAHSKHREVEDVGLDDVREFLQHAVSNQHVGHPTRLRILEAIEQIFRHSRSGVPSWLRILIEEESRDQDQPNILSHDEVTRLLSRLLGSDWLAAAFVYGTGLRLVECARLRVRDIDLDEQTVSVRDQHDAMQRTLSLPGNIQQPLAEHLEQLRSRHIRDIIEGHGCATLPPAIARQHPDVARKWQWQYLFAQRLERARNGNVQQIVLHHVDPRTLHERFEQAAVDAGIYRKVTGHVLRNTFAAHMLKRGISIRRLEALLGTGPEPLDEDERPASLVIPPEAIPGRASLH
ncbi:MAG: tyrosine-type recombinase/integrase [Wenzhouxiangellaceae bacterium]|nr:tyrosine-type recombinase/integrase [Wenzhouxiangellaceae bacterium]